MYLFYIYIRVIILALVEIFLASTELTVLSSYKQLAQMTISRVIFYFELSIYLKAFLCSRRKGMVYRRNYEDFLTYFQKLFTMRQMLQCHCWQLTSQRQQHVEWTVNSNV